jgi:ribosomal protein S18 acetylase RimI-like enzyme
MTNFEVTDSVKSADAEALKDGVNRSYAAKGCPPYIMHDLGVFLRDARGGVLAGLHGYTYLDYLYIDNIWVDDSLRGRDLGRQMMRTAEDEARRRGCHSVQVHTQSYGAPGFYEKLGYHKYVTLEDCPKGYEQLGFMKRLAA